MCFLCNQARVVQKLVNANSGLNVNRSINFSCCQMFSLLLFRVLQNVQTQNRRQNNIQIASPQSYSCNVTSKKKKKSIVHILSSFLSRPTTPCFVMFSLLLEFIYTRPEIGECREAPRRIKYVRRQDSLHKKRRCSMDSSSFEFFIGKNNTI